MKSNKFKWSEGFDVTPLIQRIEILKENNINYPVHGEFTSLVAILKSMTAFKEDIPWDMKTDILSKAVEKTISSIKIDQKELGRNIIKEIESYEIHEKQQFSIYTSINLPRDCKLQNYKCNDLSITYLKRFPNKVAEERKQIIKNNKWLPIDSEPIQKVIRIDVSSRNSEEAAMLGLDHLDFQREIWNYIRSSQWRITLGGGSQPLNSILLGPLHTFHGKNFNEKSFWYEPNFSKPNILNTLWKNTNQLTQYKKIKRKIEHHQFQPSIKKAFIKYARALDLKDHDLAIQRLWSLLEFLTDTGNSTYEKTISRAKFLYENSKYNGLILEHLRRYRNRSVHALPSIGNVEAEVYQMKNIIESLLRFHIINYFNFLSLKESCDFLDHPTDFEKLEKMRTQISYAIKVHRPKK